MPKVRRMRNLGLLAGTMLAAGFAGCSDSSSSSSGLTPEDVALGEQLRATADAYVSHSINPDDPGLAYVVTGPRGVIAEGAYGVANLEENIPITLDTPFELGSVAKQFTAMAVMILVEEGLLIPVLTNGSNSIGNVFWGYDLADDLANAYFNEPSAN